MSGMTFRTGPGGAPGLAPRRVVVAGDWHGNRYWAVNVIRRVPQLLSGEQPRLILNLGDFGIWPDLEGRRYLAALSTALAEVGAELWFVDGNHEDFPQLAGLAGDTTQDGRVRVRPGIYHLPRGHRWQWHGRSWLACGGGVSIDKALRTEGRDWWPEEEITDDQEAAIIAGGPADVLMSHDCPSGVVHDFRCASTEAPIHQVIVTGVTDLPSGCRDIRSDCSSSTSSRPDARENQGAVVLALVAQRLGDRLADLGQSRPGRGERRAESVLQRSDAVVE